MMSSKLCKKVVFQFSFLCMNLCIVRTHAACIDVQHLDFFSLQIQITVFVCTYMNKSFYRLIERVTQKKRMCCSFPKIIFK